MPLIHSRKPNSCAPKRPGRILQIRLAPVARSRLAALSVALITLGGSAIARAEYRVYQLLITNTKTSQSRTTIDTLDDLQYRGYHPVHQDESVVLQDTWMCREREGEGVRYCPNPRAAGPAAATAAPAATGPGAAAATSGPSSPTTSSTGARQPASPAR